MGCAVDYGGGGGGTRVPAGWTAAGAAGGRRKQKEEEVMESGTSLDLRSGSHWMRCVPVQVSRRCVNVASIDGHNAWRIHSEPGLKQVCGQ